MQRKAALHIIAGQLSEEKIKVGSFWWGGPAGHFRGRTQVCTCMYNSYNTLFLVTCWKQQNDMLNSVTGLVFHSCDQPMEAVFANRRNISEELASIVS